MTAVRDVVQAVEGWFEPIAELLAPKQPDACQCPTPLIDESADGGEACWRCGLDVEEEQ